MLKRLVLLVAVLTGHLDAELARGAAALDRRLAARTADRLLNRPSDQRRQFLRVEEGVYENGVWKPIKLWNGDETDRGLCFHDKPLVVRVKLGKF